MEFYSTNLAANIFLPKMVAGFYPTQNGSFIPTHFTVITKIPVDNLLMKMPAELSSTEEIFTETSRLVP